MRTILIESRKAKGLTQQQVASAVGIAIRTYQYFENGTTGGLCSIWIDLEDLLGVPVKELRKNFDADTGIEITQERIMPTLPPPSTGPPNFQ